MNLAVFSSGRQDIGILAPVIHACAGIGVSSRLVCAGLHLRGGQRPAAIEGIPVAAWLDAIPADDTDAAIASAAAATTAQLSTVLTGLAVEALLLVGDRTETLAAAVAATCLRVPIIHLHGGEVTTGAIDDACRDAICQLAHLHAVAHHAARERLHRLGIDDRRIRVTGAPALDACFAPPDVTGDELAAHLGLQALPRPLLAVTHHPATLGGDPLTEIAELIAGIEQALAAHPQALVVATAANRDAGGERINTAIAAQCAASPRWRLVEALGQARYRALLAHADVMVGNSSSGIIEAPVFGLPVLNLGERQAGRLRCAGVIDVPAERAAIANALRRVLAEPHRPRPAKARATAYGDGEAAPRIAGAIAAFARLPPRLRLDRMGELP